MSQDTEKPKEIKSKAPRKPRKKNVTAAPIKSSGHNIGIRKTRLMELAEYYGDTGLMNPRTIDPVVYMLAEMGEGAFGKKMIDNCREEIALSNADFPKSKALGYLADQLLRKYLATAFQNAGKPEVFSKLSRMPVFNQSSYVDYFMMVSMIERDTFRTDLQTVSNDLVKVVTGYQAEQPGQVCASIVNFFKVTKNQTGFEELLKGLCSLVKSRR